MRILHVSDLHIESGEPQDYCLAVLREILRKCEAMRVDALLVSGHFLDPRADSQELEGPLGRVLDTDQSIYVLPAADEELPDTIRERVTVLDGKPFELHEIETPKGRKVKLNKDEVIEIREK